MKLVIAEGIGPVIEAMDQWWRAHRSASPLLFVDELASVFEHICDHPRSHPVYRETARGTVRRAPMPKTKNHVYYVHRESQSLIVILSVWGSPRGNGPDLGGMVP